VEPRYDALVVVKTPLQLINAAEACAHFGFSRTMLYFLTSRAHTAQRISALVDSRDWTTVRYYHLDLERADFRVPLAGARCPSWLSEVLWVLVQWRRRRDFDREFRRWSGVSSLVIGNYQQHHFQHLAQLCPAARCILVDDGTDTLRIARARRDLAALATSTAPGASRRRPGLKSWVRRQAEWTLRPRDELSFFTSYDVQAGPRDQIVHNRYALTRARTRPAAADGRCLFLGQPLVEDGYVARDRYLELLAEIRDRLGAGGLQYVPHPREDRERLRPAMRRLDIPLLEISRPFELHLLSAETLPATVASFFCSGLDTCRLIWGEAMRLIAFRIAEEDLLACHDFVDEVYRYFESTGAIEVTPERAGFSRRSRAAGTAG